MDNPDRPFCSARCRLIDLGNWVAEKYWIPISTNQEKELDQPTDEEREQGFQ
jgi:endogenous inhibitor of DNA gyrase (YacG/DUF329 family)